MKPAELKEWRRKLHLTQEDAGNKLGVSQNTIQDWENGSTPIPSDVKPKAEFDLRLWKQRDSYGPVTLIYNDDSMFVNPSGPYRIPLMQREPYPSNEHALARVEKLSGQANFHSPYIRDEEGSFWGMSELQAEIARRKSL